MARVSLYTKDGYFIGDVRAATVREYILNADPNPGRCDFSIGRYDTKNTLKYLEFGQFVLVRETNLPDWVGVIVRRRWNMGDLEVTALQAEYILEKRNTRANRKITGTAGALFARIIKDTNGEKFNEKPIQVDDVFLGGGMREEVLGNSALEHVRAISARARHDFDVAYKLDDNRRLRLTGNWYKDRGGRTGRYLREGYNIELTDGILEEDARVLVNYLEGRGDASTNNTRPSAISYSEESIARFGLNQGMEIFDANKSVATVKQNTLSRLYALLDPAQAFDITAVPVNGTLPPDLNPGNIFHLDLNQYGYDHNGFGTHAEVRILGMDKNDLRGTCRLIVEKT